MSKSAKLLRPTNSPLVDAVVHGDRLFLEDYLARFGVSVARGQRDRLGRDALIASVEFGHLDLVSYLLEQGWTANVADDRGYTALEVACWKAHLGIVELLVDAGADVGLPAARKMGEGSGDAGLAQAMALKERLLDYDAKQGGTILDDQSDYYASTAWLSEEEKQALAAREERRQERMQSERRKVRLVIDAAGQQLMQVEDEENSDDDLASGIGGSGSLAQSARADVDDAKDFSLGRGDAATSLKERAAQSPYFNASLKGKAQEVYSMLQTAARDGSQETKSGYVNKAARLIALRQARKRTGRGRVNDSGDQNAVAQEAPRAGQAGGAGSTGDLPGAPMDFSGSSGKGPSEGRGGRKNKGPGMGRPGEARAFPRSSVREGPATTSGSGSGGAPGTSRPSGGNSHGGKSGGGRGGGGGSGGRHVPHKSKGKGKGKNKPNRP